MPPWARIACGMALLFQAATGGEAVGGGAVVAAPVAAPVAAAATAVAAPALDRKAMETEIRAQARADFLKEQGFASEEAYKAHLDDRKKEAESKLSDTEKREKAHKDTLEARDRAEAKAKEHEVEVKQLRADLALRDLCDAQAVRPGERRIVEVLLADEKKAKGKDFDEPAFFKDLKEKRGYLFGEGAASTANEQVTSYGTTSPAAPPAGSGFSLGAQGSFDAMKATTEQIRKWHATGGRSFS